MHTSHVWKTGKRWSERARIYSTNNFSASITDAASRNTVIIKTLLFIFLLLTSTSLANRKKIFYTQKKNKKNNTQQIETRFRGQFCHLPARRCSSLS